MNGHKRKLVGEKRGGRVCSSREVQPQPTSPSEGESNGMSDPESSDEEPDVAQEGNQNEVQHSTSDTNENVTGDSDGTTESSECGSDTEVDSVAFFRHYTALTKAAKRLGQDLDATEDFDEGSIMVIDNVEDGKKLAARIRNDPSKAITAFTHALAITETASRNVKKCGNTSSIFSIERYLDKLVDMSSDQVGNYSISKAHEILDQDARCYCEGYSLTSMQAFMEFSRSTKLVVKPRKQNKTRLNKPSFDDTIPPTQHEVVNSQVLKQQNAVENDSTTKSRMQAELKKLCQKSRKPAIGIFEYGRREAGTAQAFVKQVFDAAVMTRDGYAEFCDPASLGLPGVGQSNICGADLLLKAAEPPEMTENSFDVNRSQYILRINAKTIQALLSSGSNNDNN